MVTAASADAVRRLSPRQKQCLRLTYRRRVSKEIAAELGLGLGTVNTYCTEAIAVLGARNRRDAAEMLHLYEQLHGSPDEVKFDSAGVPETAGTVPTGRTETATDWRSLLPFRTKGAPHNDLGILHRLAWIPLLAILFAIAFGMLASGLGVVSDIIRSIQQ